LDMRVQRCRPLLLHQRGWGWGWRGRRWWRWRGEGILSPARIIRKVVAALSAAIYGDPDPHLLPLRESAPFGGLSLYAGTKYRMEGLMDEFIKSQSMVSGAIALHFINVYGPRQDPKIHTAAPYPYSLRWRGGGMILLYWEMV
jgi:nucleoside-diphosphate-sugar epimerase